MVGLTSTGGVSNRLTEAVNGLTEAPLLNVLTAPFLSVTENSRISSLPPILEPVFL